MVLQISVQTNPVITGVQFPAGPTDISRLQNVQASSGTRLPVQWESDGCFPGGEPDHLHRAQSLRISGNVVPYALFAFMAAAGTAVPLLYSSFAS
jgi:hypothetical protein